MNDPNYRALDYLRPIRVRLSCIGEWVDEQTVKFLNIEEDIQGRDMVTFVCPDCGKEHKSLRIGG